MFFVARVSNNPPTRIGYILFFSHGHRQRYCKQKAAMASNALAARLSLREALEEMRGFPSLLRNRFGFIKEICKFCL
jgi:hypothetical protein